MKLTRLLTAFAALLLFWSVNATPTFTISDGVLRSVEMHGESEAVIPNGVTCIYDGAFQNCRSLTSVVIPASVTRILGVAFEGCTSLALITFVGPQPETASENFSDVSFDCVIRVPRNISYNVNDRWYGLTVVRYDPADEPGLGSVVRWTINNGELTDVGLNGATEVIIPDSVTSIRYDAFDDCDELRSVVIPASVTHIDSRAFQDCHNITNVVMPNSMTCIIGLDAFPDPLTIETYDPNLGRGVSVRWSMSNHELAAVALNGAVNVTIPCFVTCIRSGAFDGCDELLSVVIPSSVTYIGSGAFRDCHNLASIDGVQQWMLEGHPTLNYWFDVTRLTYVVIASGVTNIGHYAFGGCDRLLGVTFPDSVSSIGSAAFEGCHELTSVAFGCSLKSVDGSAFRNCSRIMNVVVPDSVTCIWADTFPDCRDLTIETYDPAEVCGSRVTWTIREGTLIEAAFNGATDVKFPNFVTNIGDCVFRDCGNLTNITVDAENVNYSSENGLLLSKDGRTLVRGVNGDVTIPDCVTNIGYRSFNGCSGLTNVVIGDGVTSIDDGTFFDCNGLQSVTIGKGLTYIGKRMGVFPSSALKSITVDNGNVSYSSVNGLLLSKDGRSLIQGVNGAVTIPDGVVWIEDLAFSGCSGLSSVTMPDSVTSIGRSAFLSCIGLTSVSIGNGVTVIGSYAFQKCTNLTSVEIPNSVQIIKDCAFYNCSSLTNVTIPASVINIGSYAFYGCGGLTSVTLPESVTSVGSCAFSSCKHLSLALLPSHLRGSVSLDDQFRSSASDLVVLFYDGNVNDAECIVVRLDANGGNVTQSVVKTLKGYAVGELPEPTCAHYSFSGWFTDALGGERVMAETVLNENATLYAHWASLGEAIYTDNGVRLDIENGVLFSVDLRGETDVTIPCCVTEIDSCAFDGCSSMTHVTLPDSVTNIVAGAFRTCSGLSLALLPSRLKANVSGLFQNCASDLQVVFYEGCVDDIELISITLDANGGSCVRSSAWAVKGFSIGDLPRCSREEYSFLGWFTEVNGGELATPKMILNGNVTLYAHWARDVTSMRTISSNWLRLYIDNYVLMHVDLLDYPPEVIIPKWVTRIDEDAFWEDVFWTIGRIITDITIPNSVTRIDEGTFRDCGELRNVTIPQCVIDQSMRSTFPDAYASITNVVIADGATSIGDSAFSGCRELMSVTIPNSVTNISPYAFWGCGSLSQIFIPSHLKDCVSQNRVLDRYHADSKLVYYDESDWLTLRFDANGGVGDLDVLLVSADRGGVRGYAIGHLPMFTDPYFLGWFTNAEGGEQVTEETILQNDMTLYAHWAPRPIYVWAYLFDSNLSFISGGTTNSEMMVLPVFPNDDGVYTTNLTYWVKDGFEIAEVTTNGAKVVEASGERVEWTLKLSLREAKDLTVVASSRLIGSDGLPELKSDVEPEIVAAAMAGVTDMSLLANVTNAAQYLDYRNWALAMTNETVTAQMVKQSDKTWLSFALGADALIVKDLVSDDLKIEAFTPAEANGKFEFTVGVEGVNIGAGSVADETLKTNLKKVFGIEGGMTLEELSAGNVDITFGTPVDGKVKFTAGPNAKNAEAKTFFMKVKMTP